MSKTTTELTCESAIRAAMQRADEGQTVARIRFGTSTVEYSREGGRLIETTDGGVRDTRTCRHTPAEVAKAIGQDASYIVS